jgi:hypothetical protein
MSLTLFHALIDLDKLARLFAEFSRNQDLNPGEDASPDSFLPPLSDLQSQN